MTTMSARSTIATRSMGRALIEMSRRGHLAATRPLVSAVINTVVASGICLAGFADDGDCMTVGAFEVQP